MITYCYALMAPDAIGWRLNCVALMFIDSVVRGIGNAVYSSNHSSTAHWELTLIQRNASSNVYITFQHKGRKTTKWRSQAINSNGIVFIAERKTNWRILTDLVYLHIYFITLNFYLWMARASPTAVSGRTNLAKVTKQVEGGKGNKQQNKTRRIMHFVNKMKISSNHTLVAVVVLWLAIKWYLVRFPRW